MLSINTNLSSLIAQNSMNKSTIALNQAIERMTTGFKINHAKDNAANYSISKNMSTKISSYQVAQDNCAMGLDMLTTAEENLNLITDKLQRLRDLQTQASNGTYGEQSLQAINAEANALVDEIERIYANAEYNGKKLFEKAETQAVAQAATYGARAATSGKFINEVTHRNTSSMTKFSTVPEDQILASGTYSISTVAELEKLARLTNLGALADSDGNAYGSYEFVLANDIDLSSVSNWVPIGAIPDLTSSSNCFSGVFDGNGYSVKNMTINGDANSLLLGLFGAVSNATIKNLGAYVKHVHIKDYFVKDTLSEGEVCKYPSRGGRFILRAPIGEGDIDFKSCLSFIRNVGYKGAFSIEDTDMVGLPSTVTSVKKIISDYFD